MSKVCEPGNLLRADPPTSATCLAELRETIDVLNARILALVQERAAVVLEIARLKQAEGWSAYDPQREEEMLRRLSMAPSGPIDPAGVRDIFTVIFRTCLSLQDRAALCPVSGDRGSPS